MPTRLVEEKEGNHCHHGDPSDGQHNCHNYVATLMMTNPNFCTVWKNKWWLAKRINYSQCFSEINEVKKSYSLTDGDGVGGNTIEREGKCDQITLKSSSQ